MPPPCSISEGHKYSQKTCSICPSQLQKKTPKKSLLSHGRAGENFRNTTSYRRFPSNLFLLAFFLARKFSLAPPDVYFPQHRSRLVTAAGQHCCDSFLSFCHSATYPDFTVLNPRGLPGVLGFFSSAGKGCLISAGLFTRSCRSAHAA